MPGKPPPAPAVSGTPEEEGEETLPRMTTLDEQRQETLRVGVLLILGALAGWVLALVVMPLAPGLVVAAMLAVLAHPAYRRLEGRIPSPNLAALLGTTALFFLIFLPMLGLSILLVQELNASAGLVEREAIELLRPDGRLRAWIGSVSELFGVQPDQVTDAVEGQVQNLAGVLAGGTLGLLTGIGGWLLQAGVALFTLFYLLRDGPNLVTAVAWLIPLQEEATGRLVERTKQIIYATLYGMVTVAIVQGLLGGMAFWILGLPAAAFWGALMGLMSLLPVVGPPVIWGPAVLILFLGGQLWKALALLAIGGLLVGTVDNLLRAVLVSDRGQLHPLVVFLSVLGALAAFGPIGILLGPILFVLALSFVEVARIAVGPTGHEPRPGELLLERITAGRRPPPEAGSGD